MARNDEWHHVNQVIFIISGYPPGTGALLSRADAMPGTCPALDTYREATRSLPQHGRDHNVWYIMRRCRVELHVRK
jgi:hypothetical protein